MKKIIVVILFIFLSTLIFVCKQSNNDESILASDDLISKQKLVDSYIKVMSDENFTIDNPCIINNPYFISPLTSLLIFNSDKNISIDIFVNDKFYKNISDTKFIIPIVYLYEDYNNKIDIVLNGDKYTYYIKTEKINSSLIETKKNSNFKLLASSTKMKHFMMDGDGRIIWYLDLDTQGFIEPMLKDSFLIGTEESVVKRDVSNFTGIYEIDYLGKIRKRIDTSYGYHHEIKYIGENRALVLGSKDYPMDILYELDISSGNIVSSIDIHELLSCGDEDILNYLRDIDYGIETNSIDYLNGNILLSLRNINTIIELAYQKKEINYIVTNNEFIKKNLSGKKKVYEYPLMGQHNAKYINETTISLYNNGYDHLINKDTSSYGTILKVEDDIKELKRYENEKKYSYAFGSMEYGDVTVVNYPYMYKDNVKNKFTYDEYYSNLVIYDDKKEVAKYKINDNVYRARVFDFDLSSTYQVSEYKYIGNIKRENVKVKKWKYFEGELDITNNSIELFIDTLNKDIEVIFKSKNTYVLDYLNTKTFFSIEEGIYDIYIKIDDEIFKYKDTVKIS